MRAVVLRDVEKGPQVEEIEVDAPRPGEVRVRLAASGVCGSDIHVLHGTARHAVMPVVMGHEGSGVIDAVGAGVTSHQVGDHVVIALFSGCTRCRYCLDGYEVLCDSPERAPRLFGQRPDGSTTVRTSEGNIHPYTGVGAMAEYSVVPHEQAIRIPNDVPLELLALAGCGVMTGLGAAFNAAKIEPGSSVAVIGCGGVGLSVIQGARIAGATKIIALDVNDYRLSVAEKVGATVAIDSSGLSIADAVAEQVPGGADYVFEVVGSPALVDEALHAAKPGGTTVMVGTPQGETLSLEARTLFYNRRLIGTLAGSGTPAREINRIVRLYQSGLLDLDSMVTDRVPLDRGVEAIRATEAGEAARVLITMNGDE